MWPTIERKVLSGERLSDAEGVHLLSDAPLLAMGALAHEVRSRKTDPRLVTYVIDTNPNYTNLCTVDCHFCAFYRKPGAGAPDAYTHDVEGVMRMMETADRLGATTVLLQGGLNPAIPWEFYPSIVRESRRRYPHITPHFFSAPEIHQMVEVSGLPIRGVLEALYEAGQRTLPGGGAEILARRVRRRISIKKGGPEAWLDVHREAHRVGMRSTATMMYGHVEADVEVVEHLGYIRDLQDETGGFVTYIPLAFQPWEAPAMKLPETTGFEDLKAIAVGRLLLDNFPHVKSYWIMIGPRLAQVGLSFGADDLDGTVTEEKIAHDAGAPTAQSMTVHELCRLIREAGRRPIERDTVFNVVKEW